LYRLASILTMSMMAFAGAGGDLTWRLRAPVFVAPATIDVDHEPVV
jgi:hypothetical protein